jgi:hypothetical protein
MNRWEEDSRRNALAKLKITEVELRGDQAEEEMPAGDRAPTYEELMAALAQENPNHPLLHR